MARTIAVISPLVRDTAYNVATSAFQAFDNTNGMYIPTTGQNQKSGTLELELKNTNVASRTVTLKAPTNGADLGPSWRQALGDLVITVGATTGNQKIVLHDTARFKQADGTINLDCSGADVTMAVYRLPGI